MCSLSEQFTGTHILVSVKKDKPRLGDRPILRNSIYDIFWKLFPYHLALLLHIISMLLVLNIDTI